MASTKYVRFVSAASFSASFPSVPRLLQIGFTRLPVTIIALFLPFALAMTSHPNPALCSTAAYQHFRPLAGFSPALGWCSKVSLLSRGSADEANALAQPGMQCPVGSQLCNLLAELKAADREFARGVW